jgi:hypothetical protein
MDKDDNNPFYNVGVEAIWDTIRVIRQYKEANRKH